MLMLTYNTYIMLILTLNEHAFFTECKDKMQNTAQKVLTEEVDGFYFSFLLHNCASRTASLNSWKSSGRLRALLGIAL